MVLMLAQEPVIHCISWGTDKSFYWLPFTELTAFSTRLPTFLLIISRVASEVELLLSALIYLITSFASAISSLDQNLKEAQPVGVLAGYCH